LKYVDNQNKIVLLKYLDSQTRYRLIVINVYKSNKCQRRLFFKIYR